MRRLLDDVQSREEVCEPHAKSSRLVAVDTAHGPVRKGDGLDVFERAEERLHLTERSRVADGQLTVVMCDVMFNVVILSEPEKERERHENGHVAMAS